MIFGVSTKSGIQFVDKQQPQGFSVLQDRVRQELAAAGLAPTPGHPPLRHLDFSGTPFTLDEDFGAGKS